MITLGKLKRVLFIALFVLFLNTNCSGTVLKINEHSNNPNNPQRVLDEIEKRGLYIQTPANLKNVFYLAKVDSLSNAIGVAFFLEWEDEFPDFGKTFKTNSFGILSQAIIPLFYTNWFYIPNSGGLQRILFGKHDLEGIWVKYSFSNGSLGSIDFLTFELPGHKIIHFSKSDNQNKIDLVSKNNSPFIKVASWNHLFEQPVEGGNVKHFIPIPFPLEKWKNYKMNNRRAEIAKNYFEQFGNK